MLDLKLSQLRLLAQIHKTGSMSDAARTLGISISMASRTLKKLQSALDDPLFIRTWRGMVPTDRTASLMPGILTLIEEFERLDKTKVFEPSKLTFTLTICAADNAIVAILLPVMRRMMKEAPGIRFRILPLGADQLERLAEGECDFLLYPTAGMPELPAHFKGLELFPIRRSILVANDHPLAERHRSGETLTEAALAQYPKIVVKLRDGGRGAIYDVGSETIKCAGETLVEVPYFLGAPYFLEGTLCTLALPADTASFFERHLRSVTAIPWPHEVVENNTRLIWHERNDKSPHMQWIRSLFAAYAGAADGERAPGNA